MKLHLPLPLRTVLLTACGLLVTGAAHATTTGGSWDDDWGNTLYIGDSITHGFRYQSYRWQLFKTLVDNDISQNEVGIQTGYVSDKTAKNITYGGVTFENLHAAQTGITAAQVAGQGSGKLDGTGINTWLDTDSESKYKVVDSVADAAVTGSTPTSNSTATVVRPDTAFIMLGTNDVFNATIDYDTETKTGSVLDTATRIQGYLDTIITSLQDRDGDGTVSDTEAGSVNIVVTTLPTWSEDRKVNSISDANMNSAANYAAQIKYNDELKAWAANRGDVTLVDVNVGLTDVANEGTSKEGAGVGALFWDENYSADKESQHPNRQGDLIIAGNIARQLGYAGRTAGQLRVDVEDTAFFTQVFTRNAQDDTIVAADTTTMSDVSLTDSGLEFSHGGSLRTDWGTDVSSGFTVDFGFAGGLGNGSTDGWLTDSNFSLSLSDGTWSGTLNVNEAYIQWGDTILYSMDTSGLTAPLRVSYVYGNTQQNLSSGFYVWMGDMLIGEALPTLGNATTTDGISITNNSGDSVTLTHLSIAAGSWAPTTTGIVGYAEGDQPFIPADAAVVYTPVTLTGKNLGTGSNTIAYLGYQALPDGASDNFTVTVNGATLNETSLVVCKGDYTGSIKAELTGNITMSATNTYTALQYTGTLTGSTSFHLTQGAVLSREQTWGAFIGALNASVTGDISMEFSADNLVATQNTTYGFAIAGAHGNNKVGGTITITINEGEFTGNIYGGNATHNHYVSGGTAITLNGGTVNGNIYGLYKGTTQNGYGTAVTISGKATVNAATSDGTAIISASGGNGSNGKVEGNAVLTVKDVDSESNFAAFLTGGTADAPKGVLCGNETGSTVTVGGERALIFDRVQLAGSPITARMENFDSLTVKSKSDIALSSLGGASYVEVNDSHLTLIGGTHTARVQNSGTITIHEGASLTADGTDMDGNVSGTFNINGGSLTISGHDHLDTVFNISSGSLSVTDGTLPGGGTKMGTGGVHVNATGEVTLDNVALKDVQSFAVQEGGSVAASLDGGTVQLSGISSLVVQTDAASNATMTLRADSASLTMGADSASTPFAGLALGENGSLTLGTLDITLGDDYSLVTTGEGKFFVNQGSLSAGTVTIYLAEGTENRSIVCTSIGSEGGNSYVSYKLYAEKTLTGGSFDNGASAIANTAAANLSLESGNIKVTADGGSFNQGYIVAHNNDWTGDIDVTLSGTLKKAAGGYNVAQYQGTLTGSISQTIAEGFSVANSSNDNALVAGSFIGAQCTKVTGDVTMEFSSGDLKVSDSYEGIAVAGSVNTTVGGNVRLTINKGTFSGHVTGAYSGRVTGDTHVTINGGDVTGQVSGTRLNAANNGTNTISGGTNVTISGGKVKGDVYGGNGWTDNGLIKGSTSVSVTGGADFEGNIYAGSAGGRIEGSTTLTLKDITETSSFKVGTLDGGNANTVGGTRTLCFDGVRLGSFAATLQNFSNVELKGASALTLGSLGGATHLSIEAGSSLSFSDEVTTLTHVTLNLGCSSQEESGYILNNDSGSSLNLGALTLNLSTEVCDYITTPDTVMMLTDASSAPVNTNTLEGQLELGRGEMTAESVTLNLAGEYQNTYTVTSASLDTDDNGNTILKYTLTQNAAIPEPTTATLSLLALAALAARRRRK